MSKSIAYTPLNLDVHTIAKFTQMLRNPSPKRPYDSGKRVSLPSRPVCGLSKAVAPYFAQLGYGATSIEAIADHAGAAVPTYFGERSAVSQ
jgi:hypothetical protein